ncbi:Na(+)/H(+) antiporter subunit B [Streptomyces sp. NPDC088261]|uniref:Na(+)/H(+) antiporter subunit B n=1 Tax=Streptomyces sp. NPDC088261 TaxID=3365851 RepID=UPI003820FCC3
MDDVLIVVTLLLVAGAATAAVVVRDPARQALVLSLLGLTLALLFTVLQAPDVALSQLAVGSALTPLLLLLSVRKIRRRGLPRPAEPSPSGSPAPAGARDPRGTA